MLIEIEQDRNGLRVGGVGDKGNANPVMDQTGWNIDWRSVAFENRRLFNVEISTAKLRIGLPAGHARQGVKIKEFAVEQIVGPAPFQEFDVVIEGANRLWPQLGGAGRRSERAGQEPRDER